MFTLRFQSFTTDEVTICRFRAMVQPMLAAKGDGFVHLLTIQIHARFQTQRVTRAQTAWLNARFHQRAPEIRRFSLGSAIS